VLVDNGGHSGTNTLLGSVPFGNSGSDLTVQGGAVVLPPSSLYVRTLLVASDGWLRITNQTLTVRGNASVQAGGGIIADSSGYRGGSGPGAGKYASGTYGTVGGGAGYGGYGAAGLVPTPQAAVAYGGLTYGLVSTPTDLGSGGGGNPSTIVGGAGGGAINLNVTGVLQVYGTISAAGGAGNSPSAGGGSGGSIFLTVGTLSGSGVIAANGGAGNDSGGGGGGGRIAIVYGAYDFSGVVSAYGGSGYAAGGAGTIYTKANSQSWGLVVADNGGQAGTNTTLGSASPGTIDLTVQNGAVLSPPSSQTIGTLLVASNGWVSIAKQTLTVTGNAIVQAGGGIIADGTGYPAGQGLGAGRYAEEGDFGFVGGGGGYGGYGASGGGIPNAYGGGTYGSATEPTDLGSGGGGLLDPEGSIPPMGGAGGGAISLTVTGTLEVDGTVSARGLAGTGPSTGGGSGGSIYLSVGALAGSGVISANGGAGNSLGGGGGGGRIAIVYAANSFSGLVSAYGGAGYVAGGAGTIYMGSAVLPGRNVLVVVDNGGQAGTNTSWTDFGMMNDLTVRGGAVLASSAPQSVGNLVVASNGWVVLTANQGFVPTLTVAGNATVQAGCGIIADGTGYPRAKDRERAGPLPPPPAMSAVVEPMAATAGAVEEPNHCRAASITVQRHSRPRLAAAAVPTRPHTSAVRAAEVFTLT